MCIRDRLEHRLALRLQGVLEHARGQELHLIERRALIGVFVRDHLTLLGDAKAATDRAGGLGGDGPAGGGATARNRTAAAMEEGDRRARLLADAGEIGLRLRQLPVGGCLLYTS